jgi:hypothetical protein
VTYSVNWIFYIPSLTNSLSQMSPIHIFNSTCLLYIVFVSFCQSRYLPSEALLCQKFLYLSFPCRLDASSIFFFQLSSCGMVTYIASWLTLFRDLLITKLPTAQFHPDLLALTLFMSRYSPCYVFFSQTLILTLSLNMIYKYHSYTKISYLLLKHPL